MVGYLKGELYEEENYLDDDKRLDGSYHDISFLRN